MKVLIAGDWHSELHEEPVAQAFVELGHQVVKFKWSDYFETFNPVFKKISLFFKKFQNKFLWGPVLYKINYDLIKTAIKEKPDFIFIYRGTHIKPKTLRQIKKDLPGCILAGYNNDDPFSPAYPFYIWRHFKRSIPLYDIIFAYRQHNIIDYQNVGAKRVELLRSWFVPTRHHPVILSDQDQEFYGTDVVFVGHYEDDGRVQFLEEVVKKGIKLKLFGPGYDWDPVLRESFFLKSLIPVKLVWGKDYNCAIAGAKIALCFLSKLNRDGYTRRCFEIPATGTLMLSEYSEELSTLYTEGKEVDYFRNIDELIDKVILYLTDHDRRQKVARAGLERVWQDGHDVMSRMRQVIDWIESVRSIK